MNKISYKAVALWITGLFLCSSTVMAQSCHYEKLHPDSGKFKAGKIALDLGEDSGEPAPTDWIGPITISQPNGSSCTVAPYVGIVQMPIFMNDKYLLVTTFSGSQQTMYAIGLMTCKVLWKGPLFSGKVTLKKDVLNMEYQKVKLGSDCLPKK